MDPEWKGDVPVGPATALELLKGKGAEVSLLDEMLESPVWKLAVGSTVPVPSVPVGPAMTLELLMG